MIPLWTRTRAFARSIAESYGPLRRWAHHRGITGADADDVVAEVFTIAWRRFDDIPADAPVPWLYGVARNVVRNHRRGEQRRARLALAPPPAPLMPPPDEPSDTDAVMLRAALDALSDDDREILRLVAWDGLEPGEAADRARLQRGHRARSLVPRPQAIRRRARGNATREPNT